MHIELIQFYMIFIEFVQYGFMKWYHCWNILRAHICIANNCTINNNNTDIQIPFAAVPIHKITRLKNRPDLNVIYKIMSYIFTEVQNCLKTLRLQNKARRNVPYLQRKQKAEEPHPTHSLWQCVMVCRLNVSIEIPPPNFTMIGIFYIPRQLWYESRMENERHEIQHENSCWGLHPVSVREWRRGGWEHMSRILSLKSKSASVIV